MRLIGDAATFATRIQEPVHLLATDPPWKLPGSGKLARFTNFPLLEPVEVAEHLEAIRQRMVPGAYAYVFLPSAERFDEAMAALMATGWTWSRLLAWNKFHATNPGLGFPYRNAFEPVVRLSNGPGRKPAAKGFYPSLFTQRANYTRTSKPPELYRAFLEVDTHPGELAVDPYCGLNPLATAAEACGRRWISNDVLPPPEVEGQAKHKRIRGKAVRSGGQA